MGLVPGMREVTPGYLTDYLAVLRRIVVQAAERGRGLILSVVAGIRMTCVRKGARITMTFNPAIWFPISAVLTVVNVGAAWFAAQQAEPWHALTHAALGVAFGLWAQRLRRRSTGGAMQADMEALEIEVNTLRQELAEAHERLDFTERVLSQQAETRRVDPHG